MCWFWLDNHIPNGMSYKIAGTPVVWAKVLDELISGHYEYFYRISLCHYHYGIVAKILAYGLAGDSTIGYYLNVLCNHDDIRYRIEYQ